LKAVRKSCTTSSLSPRGAKKPSDIAWSPR
jgi:hypothetical protein